MRIGRTYIGISVLALLLSTAAWHPDRRIPCNNHRDYPDESRRRHQAMIWAATTTILLVLPLPEPPTSGPSQASPPTSNRSFCSQPPPVNQIWHRWYYFEHKLPSLLPTRRRRTLRVGPWRHGLIRAYPVSPQTLPAQPPAPGQTPAGDLAPRPGGRRTLSPPDKRVASS